MRKIYKKLFASILAIGLPAAQLFAQGSIDLSAGTATQWSPVGSVQKVYANIGNSFPPVTATITISGRTNGLVNNTPRSDARGLWINAEMGSRTDEIKITIDFSDPVMNLSFGVRGIDRDISGSNYQDRVAIEAFDNAGTGITPSLSYNPFVVFESTGATPNTKVLTGYNVDDFETNTAVVSFGGGGIKRLVLTYSSGAETRLSPLTGQAIFLTGFSWSNIVPVQLMYLKGKADNGKTQLNWATATELNSDYFSVQRSIDLKEFTDLGKVKSAGNSKQILEYNYFDEAPLPGVNYYRLKQVDKDGASEFSKIIAVNVLSSSKFAIFPNPSDGSSVQLQFDALDFEGLRLVDMLGREIPFEVQAISGSSVKLLPKTELGTGIYFVTYSGIGQTRTTQKLIVNR